MSRADVSAWCWQGWSTRVSHVDQGTGTSVSIPAAPHGGAGSAEQTEQRVDAPAHLAAGHGEALPLTISVPLIFAERRLEILSRVP